MIVQLTKSPSTCPQCGFADNPLEARFCGQCATQLPTRCPQCGAANPQGFRFCGQCAAPLALTASAPSTRRVVTVLFADICNYTALTNHLGAEQMYTLLDPCLRRLGETVNRFEGTIDKFVGDGLMAVFGVPMALEGHAVQATYAALAMFEELQRYNIEFAAEHNVAIQMRLGLASGEVVAGTLGSNRLSDTTVIGDVVNLAARLQQAADPDTVYINEASAHLVSPVFDLQPLDALELKGFTEPVTAFRVLSKREHPGLVRGLRGQRTPLVAREQELARLEEMTLLLNQQLGGVIVLEGEAGVGKSRLTNELLAKLRPRAISIYEGDCSSATRMVPYSAFIGVVRNMCNITPTDDRTIVREKIRLAVERSAINALIDVVPYLEYLLSIDLVDEQLLERIQHLEPEQLKRQVFLALREILLAESRRQPVLLVLDDLQWADDVSLELITFLGDTLDDAPLLLYLIARSGADSSLQIVIDALLRHASHRSLYLRLERLPDADAHQLVHSLIPSASQAVVELLSDQADGIPFYLEELVRHVLETGLDLQAQADSELNRDTVPPSLQTLLRARYDRLPQSLQTLLAQIAVLGRRFSLTTLQQLDPVPDLMDKLNHLQERAFVRPRRANPDEWTFTHMLVQETVYQSLLGEQRRALHHAVGVALEQQAGERIDEQINLLAYHFARSDDLNKAIHYGVLAAKRAAERFAHDDALRMFDETQALIEQQPSSFGAEQIQIYHGRGNVLTLMGQYDDARTAYQRALDLLATLPAPDDVTHAMIERSIATSYEKQGQYDAAMDHLEAARIALGDGDLIEHARIDADAGWIAFYRGDLPTAERLLLAALIIAQLNDQHSLQATIYNRLAGTFWRKGEFEEARHMVEKSLDLSRQLDDQVATARALNNLGVIAVEQADWAAAEEYCLQSATVYTQIGDVDGQVLAASNAAVPAMMQGHFDDALRTAYMAYRLARQIDAHLLMATSLVHQGQISFFANDRDRARRYLLEAECVFRHHSISNDKRAEVAEYLGRIALTKYQYVLALVLAQRAQRIATTINDSAALYRSERLMAYVLTEIEHYPEASIILEKLLANQQSNTYERALLLQVHSHYLFTQHYFNEGVRQGQAAEALFDAMNVPSALRRFL